MIGRQELEKIHELLARYDEVVKMLGFVKLATQADVSIKRADDLADDIFYQALQDWPDSALGDLFRIIRSGVIEYLSRQRSNLKKELNDLGFSP